MKKSLLLGLSVGIGLGVVAQNNNQVPQKVKIHPSQDVAKVYKQRVISGFESNSDAITPINLRPANPIQYQSGNRVITEAIIGGTTYDLQTNSAVQDRIYNHGDGTLSAVFTYSESGDLAAPDRGTGYVFFNGTDWSAAPTARLESERTGWPNIGKLSTNKEISIAHNTANSVLTMMKNGGPGTPFSNQSNVTVGDQVWNRMGVGGPDGLSVHQISLRAPTALNGAEFNGVDGALLYYRSLDGGNTWDIQEMQIPGFDATNFSAMSGDSYSIDVEGNTIAIAYWGAITPTMIAKSTDNGNTWTTRKLIDFGIRYDAGETATTGSVIGISDVNGDGIADTVESTDQAGSILIDENGTIHVTYGLMRYLDDAAGDDSWSYFPGTSGVMYWNEMMGDQEPVMVGYLYDLDGDGQLGGVSLQGGQFTGGDYGVSLTGFPHMALGDDGDIYVSYSAYMENIDQGTQNYRHVYITKTSDKGCSWTAPVDVTPLDNSGGLGECVFASLAKDVTTDVHMIYQRDFEPGLAVRGDEDAYGPNDIVYTKIPVADLDMEPIVNCYAYIIPPAITAMCPGDSALIGTSCGDTYAWSNGSTDSELWATAAGTYDVSITTACQTVDTFSIEISDATGTGVVDFELSSTDPVICDGDSTWISSSPVSQAFYSWSTGETTQTIGVNMTGVYSVTVNNCAGSSTQSVTISLPETPVAAITGDDMFCSGSTTTLTAGSEPGASYVWSTGDTTQMATADTVGNVMVTVTNCAGSDDATIAVSFIPAPTASFTISGNNVCEGNTVNLTAFGGDSYEWSNGDTLQFVSLTMASESNDYSVTVTNECGDSDAAAAQTVTINPLPATPTVSSAVSGGDYVFTSTAAENKWYSDGVLVQSSGDTYTASGDALAGVEITAVAIDGTTGCESVISNAEVAVPVGIETIITASDVKVFPNPNNGEFTVVVPTVENVSVEVKNILGQSVFNGTVNGTDAFVVNLGNVEKGIYFLNVNGENYEVTQKVIVK